MAFTIQREPDTWSPAFNHLTYKVYSTNYNKPNMRYIFELYVNDNLVNTSKMFPAPNGTCIYDPSKIIQNYLTEYESLFISEGTYSNVAETATYYVKFKEEYYVDSTLNTFLRETGKTKYTWYAAADWMAARSLLHFTNNFMPDSSRVTQANAANYLGPNKYLDLTDINRAVLTEFYKIRPNERRVISFFTRNQNRDYFANRLYVATILKTPVGTTSEKFFYKDYTFSTSSTARYQMFHFPVGIEQLNSLVWTNSIIPAGRTASITPDEDAAYYVWWTNGPATRTHRSIGFEIVDDCDRFDHYTVYYQSPKGGWWYINMDKRSEKTTNVNKSTMKNYLSYNYIEKKEIKVIHTEAQGLYKLQTDWLRNQADVEDVKDMLESPNIYLLDEDENMIPVTVNNSIYEIKNVAQDKLVNYTITFNEAFNKNVMK
jgi:hypothetical protein